MSSHHLWIALVTRTLCTRRGTMSYASAYVRVMGQDSMQEAAEAAGQEFGYPFMLKTKRLAYDGRGNAQVCFRT